MVTILLDAHAAVFYFGPTIVHTPLGDTENTTDPYVVSATITARSAVDPGRLRLFWRVDGGGWQQSPLVSAGGDDYAGEIPAAVGGGGVPPAGRESPVRRSFPSRRITPMAATRTTAARIIQPYAERPFPAASMPRVLGS